MNVQHRHQSSTTVLLNRASTMLNNVFKHILQYMQCNAMQYHIIQYNTIQYNTMQFNTMQHNTIQYNSMNCNVNVMLLQLEREGSRDQSAQPSTARPKSWAASVDLLATTQDEAINLGLIISPTPRLCMF